MIGRLKVEDYTATGFLPVALGPMPLPSRAAPTAGGLGVPKNRIRRVFQRSALYLLAIAVSVGLTTLYHRRESLGAPSPPASILSAFDDPSLTIVHHYPDKPGAVHVPGTPLDACRILEGCFPDPESIYHDHASCVSNMTYILRRYPSSSVIQDGRVVGFLSLFVEEDPDRREHKAILTYNVCVDPKLRGRGLAKRMLKESIDALVAHKSISTKSLLLALDVDLTSQMAAEAFTMYAKLGYLRGWQPCRSVGDVDWRPLFDQPTSPALRSPIQKLLDAPKQYQEDELVGKNPSPRLRPRSKGTERLDHYCMFRFYEESWLTLGNYLAEPFRTPASQASDG